MACRKQNENRHTVCVGTTDIAQAFRQITIWAESEWWPPNCIMKFSRTNTEPVQKGTLYQQHVQVPFGPRWKTIVSDINPDKSLSRRFMDGPLDGEETIRILPGRDTVTVDYCLKFNFRQPFDRLLWRLCFRYMHDHTIQSILHNLKYYLEQRHKEAV